MRIDILTIFPDIFRPFLDESLIGHAREKRLLDVHVHNIRDFTTDKHNSVDDRPYGGGAGMVMKPEPIFATVEHALVSGAQKSRRILLTPQGKPLSQKIAQEFSEESGLLLICGRYEGFDERIREGLGTDEISVGDYVCFGGEAPAMILIEAVVRLIPGVLGAEESAVDESFQEGLLEYPQYTRPPEFRGMKVPEILLSGNHEAIRKWREEQARQRTRQRRADLIKRKTQK